MNSTLTKNENPKRTILSCLLYNPPKGTEDLVVHTATYTADGAMCDSVENITQLASPYRRQHCATPLLRSITPVDKSLPNIQFRIMTFHEFPTAIPYEPVVVVVTAFGDVYHFFFTFSLGRNNDSSPPESSDSCLWPLVSSLFFICRFSFFCWYETYSPLGRFDFSTLLLFGVLSPHFGVGFRAPSVTVPEGDIGPTTFIHCAAQSILPFLFWCRWSS